MRLILIGDEVNKLFFFAFIITLALHSILWMKLNVHTKEIRNPKKIVLHSIKNVGTKNGTTRSIKLKDRQAGKRNPDPITQKGKKNKISLSDLANQNPVKNSTNPLQQIRPKLGLNKNGIQSLVQDSIANTSARELLKNLGDSDINIKFDVPKGVKIDELNKAELKLYSFQRRTAINYVNTFYKELRDFQHKNPHLKFPIVKHPDLMTGRVTYDINGDIVRIQMVRWSEEERLQDFFLEMLKELNKLPNPPKEIVQNGEFTIYYSLDIKI